MRYILPLFIILLLQACARNDSQTEKKQKQRDNIIDVKNEVKEVPMDDVLIGSMAVPYICGNYLVIADHQSTDKMIHFFDRKNHNYLFSVGELGQGPTEISLLGPIAWNNEARELYATDHGQRRILSYSVDSLLNDPNTAPNVKLTFKKSFPSYYTYINDTLSYGLIIEPTSTSTFKQTVGKWNMSTQEIELIDYTHPAIKEKRIIYDVSTELNTLVECNRRYDLITLYDLDGALKCNIYGPNWDEKDSRTEHFSEVAICEDKIFAAYDGSNWSDRTQAATIIHLFSIDGDYLKTLNIGRKIIHFCYDKENKRLIMNLDSEYQFAYLDVEKYL